MKKIYAEGQWISVKDKLPEIGSEVIVLTNDGNVTALNLYLQEIITHWMLLPNPPKEGAEK